MKAGVRPAHYIQNVLSRFLSDPVFTSVQVTNSFKDLLNTASFEIIKKKGHNEVEAKEIEKTAVQPSELNINTRSLK